MKMRKFISFFFTLKVKLTRDVRITFNKIRLLTVQRFAATELIAF